SLSRHRSAGILWQRFVRWRVLQVAELDRVRKIQTYSGEEAIRKVLDLLAGIILCREDDLGGDVLCPIEIPNGTGGQRDKESDFYDPLFAAADLALIDADDFKLRKGLQGAWYEVDLVHEARLDR